MCNDDGDDNESIRLQNLGTGSSAENTPAARMQQRDGMQQHTTESSAHVGYQERGKDESCIEGAWQSPWPS